MKFTSKVLALLIALTMVIGLLAGCGGTDAPAADAPAAPAAPAEPAAPEKSDKLVVYSPATEAQVNAIIPLFEEKYGVEVEVITGGTGELLARVDAEGDNPYADVIFGGGESSYSEYAHIFQDYVSSEDANLLEDFRNTKGLVTN